MASAAASSKPEPLLVIDGLLKRFSLQERKETNKTSNFVKEAKVQLGRKPRSGESDGLRRRRGGRGRGRGRGGRGRVAPTFVAEAPVDWATAAPADNNWGAAEDWSGNPEPSQNWSDEPVNIPSVTAGWGDEPAKPVEAPKVEDDGAIDISISALMGSDSVSHETPVVLQLGLKLSKLIVAGKVLIGGANDGNVYIWNLEALKKPVVDGEEDAAPYVVPIVSIIPAHKKPITDIAFNRVDTLATSAEESVAKLWDIEGYVEGKVISHSHVQDHGLQPKLEIKGQSPIQKVDLNGKYILTSTSKEIQYWRSTGIQERNEPKDSPSQIQLLSVFFPSEESAYAALHTGGRVFESRCVDTVLSFPCHSFILSPDGSLATCYGQTRATLVDAAAGRMLMNFKTTTGSFIQFNYSPIRYWLCGLTTDRLAIVDLETKQVVHAIYVNHPSSMVWSTDGNTLYITTTTGMLHAYGFPVS